MMGMAIAERLKALKDNGTIVIGCFPLYPPVYNAHPGRTSGADRQQCIFAKLKCTSDRLSWENLCTLLFEFEIQREPGHCMAHSGKGS